MIRFAVPGMGPPAHRELRMQPASVLVHIFTLHHFIEAKWCNVPPHPRKAQPALPLIACTACATWRRIERDDMPWASSTICVTEGVVRPPRPRRPGASADSAAQATSSKRSRSASVNVPESIALWSR